MSEESFVAALQSQRTSAVWKSTAGFIYTVSILVQLKRLAVNQGHVERRHVFVFLSFFPCLFFLKFPHVGSIESEFDGTDSILPA